MSTIEALYAVFAAGFVTGSILGFIWGNFGDEP